MAKKLNKSIVKSAVVANGEKAIINNADNCIIPDNQTPANITRNSYYDLMRNALQINIARAETNCHEMELKRYQVNRALTIAGNNLLDFEKEYTAQKNENAINDKAAEFMAMANTIGLPMTEQEAKAKAIQALGINTLQVNSKPARTRTLSINASTNTGNTDNDLINRTCLQYQGASFKQLPVEVQNTFNSSTRAKYPAVSGYYKQLLTNAANAQGNFADMIKVNGAQNITLEMVNEMVKAKNIDASTKGRFIDALKIFKHA